MIFSSTSLFKRLYSEYINTYIPKILLAIVCMIFAALSTAALPYLIKDVFDDVFKSPDMYRVIIFGITLFCVFIVKAFSSYGESITLTYVGQRIIADIQSRLFKHLMTLDLNFFHNFSSGDLLSRFTNDVQLMRTAFTTTVINIGKDSITLIALITLMFYRDPLLATISFVVFPLTIFPIFKMGRRAGKMTYKSQGQMGDLTTKLSQVFQSIRVVKAYHSESIEQKKLDTSVNDLFKTIYKTARVKCSAHPLIELLSGVAVVLVISYGGWQVSQNTRTTGDFISFIFALLLVYEPLKRLSQLNANIHEGLSAVRRIYEIFDIMPTIINKKNAIPLKALTSDIIFDHVDFAYDQNQRVLNGLTFNVPFGKSIAFVGPSGSGKSTIINLIPRFYDVLKGQITINGLPLQDYDIESLRSKIALVSQEIALFDCSIYDNIAYGSEQATKEDIIEAAKGAFAHDFIMSLPNQYDTFVGENGVRLSGGQRQRIAIARAMVKNAPLLLLDEATSALDTESERQVQEAIQVLMKDRTTIMVAHRLSTVINVDIIYFLKNGKIIEQGSHDDLLKLNGEYAALWYTQIEKN